MLTEKDLDKLQMFGKETDGSYCDRLSFIIKRTIHKWNGSGRWDFCHFSEVDGSSYYIKTLKDMDDLKNVYKAISNKELI